MFRFEYDARLPECVNTEPNPEEPEQPLTYTMKSATFLCAPPNCVYQDFELLAVSPAFPAKPSPEPDLFPASSNLWEPLAVSGSGTTWGTSEDGVLPGSEYVPTNATISICEISSLRVQFDALGVYNPLRHGGSHPGCLKLAEVLNRTLRQPHQGCCRGSWNVGPEGQF